MEEQGDAISCACCESRAVVSMRRRHPRPDEATAAAAAAGAGKRWENAHLAALLPAGRPAEWSYMLSESIGRCCCCCCGRCGGWRRRPDLAGATGHYRRFHRRPTSRRPSSGWARRHERHRFALHTRRSPLRIDWSGDFCGARTASGSTPASPGRPSPGP